MILILTQCFPSQLGGVESLMSNLAINISKSEKVIVYADKHDTFYDAIFDSQYKEKILVKRFGGIKFFRRRKKIKDTKLLIETNKVKLVIADSWKSIELAADYLYRKKISTTCLAHGNELLTENKNKIKRITKTFKNVTTIISNSVFTENLVKKFVPLNFKINIVHPGASDLQNIDEVEIPYIFGSPIVLTIARLEKRKGHVFVIRALSKIVSKFPNLKYIIAGEGPEKKFLQNQVLKYNMNKNIIFVGNINENKKKYLFNKSNLMIMPTLDESKNNSIEGFGITYIEAAFFAIPSIASNVGGSPEAVLNNKTGIIINEMDDLENAITKLLSDDVYLQKLGMQAKERALKEFCWSDIYLRYLQ